MFSSGVRVKFKHFTLATCSLPLCAFIFCIIYSLIFNFRGSTFTACGATNFLPSISAAIGGFSPQREVWQAAISLDFIPRLVLIYVFWSKYAGRTAGYVAVYVQSVLMFVENFGLLWLTYFDSTNSYTIHRNSFTLFIVTSLLHMGIFYCTSVNNVKEFVVRRKKRLAVVNLLGVIFSMVCFVIHGLFCPNFVYSFFALFEYVVVLSNIAYHGAIYCHFPDAQLVLSPIHGIRLETSHQHYQRAASARRKLS